MKQSLIIVSLFGAILSSFVLPTMQLPIISRSTLPEPRCLKRGNWSACNFEKNAPLETFHTFEELQVDFDILSSRIDANSVTCTGLKFYQKSSTSPCPATCRFSKQKDVKCDKSPSSLLQVDTPPSGTPIVTVRSTDSDCSATQNRYPRRQMCLYNIDMSSCPSEYIQVNDASHLNITTQSGNQECSGDFLLVMLSNGQRYKKVCGSSWPSFLHRIHDTKFKVLFWSGQNYETRGTGFKLQLECHKPVQVVPSPTTHHESTRHEEPSSTPVHHDESSVITTVPTEEPSPTPLDNIEASSSGDSIN